MADPRCNHLMLLCYPATDLQLTWILDVCWDEYSGNRWCFIIIFDYAYSAHVCLGYPLVGLYLSLN
jgi:hypothetical protein